ncbi:MAG: hypothetical protein WAV76_16815 [Bacteroidota bacterium]
MNTKTYVLKNVSTRLQSLTTSITAIGLGVTLSRIFHLAGLGSVMLPAIGLRPSSILASYPGILFKSVFSILSIIIARRALH